MNDRERTYPQGVPCWVDTEREDPHTAVAFYGELFGWSFEDGLPPEVPGSYLVASLDGQPVGAIASGAAVAAERPEAVWSTYVAVDDAEWSAAAIRGAGGTVLAGPQDAGPAGRWVVCRDPTGTDFRLWQAGDRSGSQAVNAPGGFSFNDLRTADRDGAIAFYGELFGWEADPPMPGGNGTLRRPGYGDHLAATSDPGIFERQAAVGAPPGFADVVAWLAPLGDGESAPRWNVTFGVEDRDASAAAVERLGGEVVATQDTPWTKAADVRDPEGARFSLSQFAPPEA